MATDVSERTAAAAAPRASRWRSFPRNIWRQLTSMRSALILLFLLALASVPGALIPQWTTNATKAQSYLDNHGWWGDLLNRLGFFNVFSSPWYAAIYLLLFTSLVGCLVPRSWEFARTLGQPPVVTPRNLARLPLHAERTTQVPVAGAADRIVAGLRGWRVARRTEGAGPGAAVTISAEKGYLREVGNLVFHLSLLGLLVAVAVGKLFGYEASVIVTAGLPGSGSEFCSQAGAYDEFRPGTLVDGTAMAPFCLNVDSFSATYNDTGEAQSFATQIRSSANGSGDWSTHTVEVNDPLHIAGQRVYLLGHGYSPTFTVTYPDGHQQSSTVPFTPEDELFTSQGAVKFLDPPGFTAADQRTHQLAIVGIFAPSASIHGGLMTSTYPAAEQPGVAVDIYQGDVGLDTGMDQSIFSIDMNQVSRGLLVKQARVNLALGESTTLPDRTKITFSGLHEWVSLQTSYDPAQGWALAFAALLLIGLMTSLIIKRRRVWYRITPGTAADPTTRVEIGGLARTDQAGYGSEFERLAVLAGDPDRAGPARRGLRGWR